MVELAEVDAQLALVAGVEVVHEAAWPALVLASG